MSDAAVVTIVSGVITVVGMIVGFLTLWVKLQHASAKAEDAANKVYMVERKLDDNTVTTNAVNVKTDTIVQQTDGALAKIAAIVELTSARVDKLEAYNRESSHRLFDAVNTLALKVERLLVAHDVTHHQPEPAPRTPK